jgi:chaperonin cofactor prefoldin
MDQLNAANKYLHESTGKLKNDIEVIRKTSDKRQERVEELEKQLSMAGDSVNLLMVM